MNNLKLMIKQKVGTDKYPTLTRIKIGRILNSIALLPVGTSFLHLIAVPMCMPLSFSMWANDRIRWYKEGRTLR